MDQENIGKPQTIDMIVNGTDFIIVRNGIPIRTRSNVPLSSSNQRLIQHVIRDLTLGSFAEANPLSAFTLLLLEKEAVTSADSLLDELIPECLATDPFVVRSSSPRMSDDAGPDELMELMESDFPLFSVLFEGVGSVIKSFNTYLMEQSQSMFALTSPPSEDFIRFVRRRYEQLSPSAKAATIGMMAAHDAGILLPMLLVESRITSSEYATFLMGAAKQMPGSSAKRVLERLKIEGLVKQTLPDWNQARLCFARLRLEANEVSEYLSCAREDSCNERTAAELIRAGESFTLEFKTSLRMNIVTQKKDPVIEHATLKTIAAFLNSSGGVLMIGVRDDTFIAGIETDEFESTDKFLLHFWNLIKSSIGSEITPFIASEMENVSDKTVCIVRCRPCTVPVFLRQKGFPEEFYIRVGPSSTALGLSDTLRFIRDKFDQKAQDW
jgi:hypothetical protein